MRVLLVRPWVNKKIATLKNFLFGEPLGIECVATALKELGHEVLLVDFMLEPRETVARYMEQFRPEAVGVTSQCTDVENVLRIAREAKACNPEILVMVGGVQATCFPEAFFCSDVDYVFRSTGRENLAAVFSPSGDAGAPREIPGVYSKSLDFKNQGVFCLNEYIPPDRTSTARYRDKYQYVGFSPCALIQTAYGCRNRCSFCIRWKLEGGDLRELPVEEGAQDAAVDGADVRGDAVAVGVATADVGTAVVAAGGVVAVDPDGDEAAAALGRQVAVVIQAVALAHGFFDVFHALDVAVLEAANFQAKAVGAQVDGSDGFVNHGLGTTEGLA